MVSHLVLIVLGIFEVGKRREKRAYKLVKIKEKMRLKLDVTKFRDEKERELNAIR